MAVYPAPFHLFFILRKGMVLMQYITLSDLVQIGILVCSILSVILALSRKSK